MANNKGKKRDYVRNPYPKVWTELNTSDKAFQPSTEYTFEYHNKSNETSEIKKISFLCPPNVQISVEITKDNQKRTIHEAIYAKDVNYCMRFKDNATDKTLTLGTNEYIYIKVSHTYLSNQGITVILDKDQLLWNPGVVKEGGD